ncbi:MAG: hypothetical protein ACREMQ_13195, partial [Longimicrobiales bacterium]
LKANAFGFKIREIPALLEWKEYKHSGRRVARQSSSSVGKLVVSHSLFSLFANPVRYVWAMSLASFVLGVLFFLLAAVLFALRMVSVYTALMSVSLILLSLVLFVMGVVVKQGFMVQRELWVLQRYQVLAQGQTALLGEQDVPAGQPGAHETPFARGPELTRTAGGE